MFSYEIYIEDTEIAYSENKYKSFWDAADACIEVMSDIEHNPQKFGLEEKVEKSDLKSYIYHDGKLC